MRSFAPLEDFVQTMICYDLSNATFEAWHTYSCLENRSSHITSGVLGEMSIQLQLGILNFRP